MPTLTTVTVKSSGGDYLTLDAAFAGEAADITAATGSDEIIRIDSYPFEDTKNCIIDDTAWVTGPTNYVELRFLDSGGDPLYTSKWSTSAYRLVGKSAVFENNQVDHLWHTEGTFQIIDDLGTLTSTASVFKVSSANGGFNRFDGGGILIANHNSGTAWRGIKVDAGVICRWRNWIIYGGNKESVFSPAIDVPNGSGTPTLEFENCTFDDWSLLEFVAEADTTLILKNCRATNLGSQVAGASNPDRMDTSSDHNITDGSTANEANWGTNSIDSGDAPTISYTDDSNATLINRDYTLATTTDSGYEMGVDLSSSFTADIANTPRTVPWDMGAHELSVGAATARRLKIHNHTLNIAQIRSAVF